MSESQASRRVRRRRSDIRLVLNEDEQTSQRGGTSRPTGSLSDSGATEHLTQDNSHQMPAPSGITLSRISQSSMAHQVARGTLHHPTLGQAVSNQAYSFQPAQAQSLPPFQSPFLPLPQANPSPASSRDNHEGYSTIHYAAAFQSAIMSSYSKVAPRSRHYEYGSEQPTNPSPGHSIGAHPGPTFGAGYRERSSGDSASYPGNPFRKGRIAVTLD